MLCQVKKALTGVVILSLTGIQGDLAVVKDIFTVLMGMINK